MVDITGLYFVIADADQARFVRPGPDSRLHTIQRVDGTDLRDPDADFGQDSDPGQVIPFAGQLARRLNDDCAVDLFRYLVLVAPPRMLRDLEGAIDDPTRASLIGRLSKDLVTVSDADLWTHLDAWVLPARAA